MKKKIKKVVIVTLILAIAGISYIYFGTDLLKSDKQIFFSYISKDNILEIFEDEKIEQYLEKQQNTAYTNKGEVTFKTSGDESLQTLNNTSITLEGKNNTTAKLAEQNITLDFGQGFNIPIKFKRDGESIGIQNDSLNAKFLAVKNENLPVLANKLGLESDDIPEKIDFTTTEFSEKELKTLENRYIKILKDNLPKELFSKQKVEKQKIITLNMSKAKLIEVLTKIFETVRNDEIILSKIPKTYEVEDFQMKIDEILEQLDVEDTSGTTKIEIKICIEGKKVKKYEITTKNDAETESSIIIENQAKGIGMKIYEYNELSTEISLVKENNENDVAYKMIIKTNSDADGESEINFTIQYKNIAELDNVEELYNVNISYNYVESYDEYEEITDDKVNIDVNYKNLKTFAPDAQIEGFNEDNSIILNDATDEEVEDIITNIYTNMGIQ